MQHAVVCGLQPMITIHPVSGGWQSTARGAQLADPWLPNLGSRAGARRVVLLSWDFACLGIRQLQP